MAENMVKAVEVSLDGVPVGVFVPPAGGAFMVFVGNIPRTYMRAQVLSGTKTESWSWQLPDVKDWPSSGTRVSSGSRRNAHC